MEMKVKGINSPNVLSRRARIFLGGTCILLAMLLITGAASIPFLFESPSILYKFGLYKIILRTGKVMGVTAGILVFCQVLLVSRLKILDRIFSLNRIYNLHRINGMTIASLALLHPVFIIASEKFTFFPFEKRYWPEFLGVGVLTLIVFLVINANWRAFFGMAYHKWLRFHRIGALLAISLMPIHILFVSETFKSGLPRASVFVAGGITLLLIIKLLYRRFFSCKEKFVVSSVEPVARNTYSVDVRPCEGKVREYIPGQFAFITPVSEHVPQEEHPFTIASSLSRPDTLQFVVRALGDWTHTIHRLKIGDPVCIDGPYGLFSHMIWPANDPVIMIAGGIGITPMLSMLRNMADTNDPRKVLLIWSNKTREHIVFPEEFEDLERRLQEFRIVHVMTENTIEGDRKMRMDKVKLERLLAECSRKSRVFICGPSGMMNDVSRALKKIGFLSNRVYKEEFKL
ncbi:MAG: ferredoxin reductase family protein [Desulfobacterales bacterium]